MRAFEAKDEDGALVILNGFDWRGLGGVDRMLISSKLPLSSADPGNIRFCQKMITALFESGFHPFYVYMIDDMMVGPRTRDEHSVLALNLSMQKNLTDDYGCSLFHHFLYMVPVRRLKALGELAFDVDLVNNRHETPLVLLLKNANSFLSHSELSVLNDRMDFVLERGADFFAKDIDGNTPFDLCLAIDKNIWLGHENVGSVCRLRATVQKARAAQSKNDLHGHLGETGVVTARSKKL